MLICRNAFISVICLLARDVCKCAWICIRVYVCMCIFVYMHFLCVNVCMPAYVDMWVLWLRGCVGAWICECVVVGMYGCVGWGGGRSGVDCDGVCVYVYLCVCVCVCVCVCTCMCVWQAALASTVEAMKERGNVRQIMNTLKTSLPEVYTVCVCV